MNQEMQLERFAIESARAYGARGARVGNRKGEKARMRPYVVSWPCLDCTIEWIGLAKDRQDAINRAIQGMPDALYQSMKTRVAAPLVSLIVSATVQVTE